MSVYFITARRIGLVKIGFTKGDPKKRIASIRTSCPAKLKLEALLPGDAKYERELHQRFAPFRSHGEWFRLSKEIDDFIRQKGITAVVLEAPPPKALQPRAPSKIEIAAAEAQRAKEMFEEAKRIFATLGPSRPHVERHRFYHVVPAGGGQHNRHFAVRGEGGHRNRLLGADLRLTWDQADRLCDLLEEVREYAIGEGVEA